MLINKFLYKNNYIIVRSVELNYLKYLMDLGLRPIIKVRTGKYSCLNALVYDKNGSDIHLYQMSILSISNIKELLYNLKLTNNICKRNLIILFPMIRRVIGLSHICINRDLI